MALIQVDFRSQALKLATSAAVILPDPPPDAPRRCKAASCGARRVLWLLHGLSDDHTAWLRRTSIERYVEGRGIAVVMPAVHRSFYADMAEGGRYWEFVSEELPALARGWFALPEAREANAVAGLSMGGYGAFKHALAHPDRYFAAASLSGALDVRSLGSRHDVDFSGEMARMLGPLDAVAGSDNDLFALAERLVASDAPRPRLYQWCGLDDFLYEDNLRFRDHARQIGLDIDYSHGPGGHTWDRWDEQIREALRWLGWTSV